MWQDSAKFKQNVCKVNRFFTALDRQKNGAKKNKQGYGSFLQPHPAVFLPEMIILLEIRVCQIVYGQFLRLPAV